VIVLNLFDFYQYFYNLNSPCIKKHAPRIDQSKEYGKNRKHRMWFSQRKSSATSSAEDKQVEEHGHPEATAVAIKSFAVTLTAATCHIPNFDLGHA